MNAKNHGYVLRESRMHGNVYEWCVDWYDAYPTGVVTDPLDPTDGLCRVLRGGGWDHGAQGCRSASRYYYGVSYWNYGVIGFRLSLVPNK